MVDIRIWGQLSLPEQMGHIGGELKLARDAEDDDLELRDEHIDASLELLELTLKDFRFRKNMSELEYLHTAIMNWKMDEPSWPPQSMVNYCASFLLDEMTD